MFHRAFEYSDVLGVVMGKMMRDWKNAPVIPLRL
jgi:hypothetical protein